MTIHFTPEALHAMYAVCGTVCVLAVCHLGNRLVGLRAARRRDALFEAMAREAMASGRPVTFTHDSIKRQ